MVLREFSELELELIAHLQEGHKAGSTPAQLLHLLADNGVEGVNLHVLMEAAFPSLKRTKVIGVWSNQKRLGDTTNDGLVNRRLAPFMPSAHKPEDE